MMNERNTNWSKTKAITFREAMRLASQIGIKEEREDLNDGNVILELTDGSLI